MGRIFFRFVPIHAFDGQTDGRTDGFLMALPCFALHAVARLKYVVFQGEPSFGMSTPRSPFSENIACDLDL